MLYFMQFNRIPNTLINENDSVYLKVDLNSDRLHFAVSYLPDLAPSGFGYRVYIRQVDSEGVRIDGSIMYGLSGLESKIMSENSVHAISVIIHKLITVKSGMMYKYTSHEVASNRFTNVQDWGQIFTDYTAYSPIFVDSLDLFHTQMYLAERFNSVPEKTEKTERTEKTNGKTAAKDGEDVFVRPSVPVGKESKDKKRKADEIDSLGEFQPFNVDSFFAIDPEKTESCGAGAVECTESDFVEFIEQELPEDHAVKGDSDLFSLLSECFSPLDDDNRD